MQHAIELLEGAQRIAILTHTRPDGDAIGSACGLWYLLKALEKESYVCLDDTVTEQTAFLIPEQSRPPEGFQPDLIVAVDAASWEMLPAQWQQRYGHVDLCLDHHISNTHYAAFSVINGQAAAAGELIYQLFEKMKMPLEKPAALCLYVAIATDTGCFAYSNVTPRTFLIASKLREVCGPLGEVNHFLFSRLTRSRLAAQKLAMGALQFYFDGRCAVLVLDDAMRRQSNATEDDIASLVQLPRSIEGVEIGITLKQDDERAWRISMRSNRYLDVSALCQQFGGGGHIRAAGARMQGSAKEVIETLLAAVQKELQAHDELGRNSQP